jgi:hypothetical protein
MASYNAARYIKRCKGLVNTEVMRDKRFQATFELLENARLLRRRGESLSEETIYGPASLAAERLTPIFAEFYEHQDYAFGASICVMRAILENPDQMSAAQGLAAMTNKETTVSMHSRRLLADLVAAECPSAVLRKSCRKRTGKVVSMESYLHSRG